MPAVNRDKGFRSLSYVITFIFILVNAFTGHPFYHVNSLKIALLLGCLALALPVVYYHYPRFQFRGTSLQAMLFALAPVWLSFPGYLYSGGANNYYFPYEMAAFCGLACWMVIVREVYRQHQGLDIVFKGMGVLAIGVCLYALVHAVQHDWVAQMIKSTFGNRNYFVGFLLQLFPLFLSMGPFLSARSKRFGVPAWFYWTVASVLLGTLFLTRSRAGMLGACVTGFFVLAAHFYLRSSPPKRKIWAGGILGLVFLGLLIYVGLVSFHQELAQNRAFNLLTFDAWYDRFHSLKAALSSIAASPWVGWGLGSSYNLYFLFVPPESRMIMPERSFNHVHCEPLEVFQEGGVLSLLALVFFWGFVFYKGFALLCKEERNSAKTALLVGLLGSFLAYNLQSLVSVAPRMMVVRLPLFFNLGLFFTFFDFNPLSRWFRWIHIRERAKIWGAGAVPVVLAVAAISIYWPWAEAQWNHTKLVSQRRLSKDLVSFYRRSLQYDDIYTSSYLASLFFRLNMLPEAKRAIDKTQSLIPHYQNIDFIEGSYYFRLNDLQKAKEALKIMQQYDRFHKPTNRILMHIAVALNDREEWVEQFEIVHYIPMRETGILDKRSVLRSRIEFSDRVSDPQNPEMALATAEKTSEFFRLVYHKSFVLQLLAKLNQLRFADTDRGKKVEQAFQFVVNRINQHPFFRIHLRPGVDSKVMPRVRELVSQQVFIFNQIENYAGRKEQGDWLRRRDIVADELDRYVDWKEMRQRVNFSRLVAKRVATYALDNLRF